MAEATLNDLLNKLKEQNKNLSTLADAATGTKVTDIENTREQAKKDEEVVDTLQKIAETLGTGIEVDIPKSKEKGILGSFKEGLLGGLGLPKDMTLGKLLFGNIGKKIAAMSLTFGTSLGTAFASVGKTFATAIGPKLMSTIGPLALIAGIALAIKDGIAGYFKADEWGVSKISAVMGSILGGSGKGWKNAFANAGKWALIGVGIGMIGGPVGMLVGGLVGAAIGGILGFIGGENLAKGFDGLGAWFMKQFNTLILGPIKAVWDFIAPDWAKAVTDEMQWSDLMPPALTKLFNGEYFTIDFPEFSWTDLFPQFLVDLFNNIKVAGKDTTFEWKDLLPEFFVKFFKGEYSKEGSFSWRDLVPGFILKVIDIAETAWAKTDFTWKSLLPGFIVKALEHDWIKPTGEFSWSDLVPTFISDLITAGKKAGATETGEFDWTRLLPDWMIGAWDSTKGLIKQAGGGHLLEGEWWLGLLPDFIANILRDDKKKAQALETVSLAMDWWKSLLPGWIVNVLEGKSPFAERDEGADEKKVVEAKAKLDESVAGLELPDFGKMFDIGTLLQPVRDKVMSVFSDENIPTFVPNAVAHFMRDTLLKLLPTPAKEGGLVGLSPFAKGSMGKAMGLESGGLFTLSQGEMVLDNQATAQFLKAAQLLTGSQALEQSKVGGAPIVINNIDQSQQTQTNMNRTQNLNVGSNSPHNENSTLSRLN